MKIVSKQVNNIPVTIIKTKKFKSLAVELHFKSPIEEKKMTYRSVLKHILIESCSKYNTSEKLYANTLENYDAYYNAYNTRVGNYLINTFAVITLADKYTEKGNLKNVIDTFCEIVFNPLVKKGSFDKDTFDMIIERKKTAMKRIKEENSSYAEYMLYHQFNPNKAYSFIDKEEYIDEITPENLYLEYKNMIEESEVSLVICGDVEDDYIEKTILSHIKHNKKYNLDILINNDDEKLKYVDKEIQGVGSQGVLTVVSYLRHIDNYELHYVLPLYRIILGGGTNSRLFEKIREEKSLAYYSFARLEKDDNMLMAIMGIENKNYKQTLKLVHKIMKSMKIITKEELEDAKKTLITNLMESEDSLNGVISRKSTAIMYNLPEPKTFIKKIESVSIKDVEKVANKINPDFSFYVKAGK